MDNEQLKEKESDEKNSNDPLVNLLYFIIRDYVPCGSMECIIKDLEERACENIDTIPSLNNNIFNSSKWLAARIYKLIEDNSIRRVKEGIEKEKERKLFKESLSKLDRKKEEGAKLSRERRQSEDMIREFYSSTDMC